MAPPPVLVTLVWRNSSGSPIIFPSQFITTVSSSVHAGLEAWKRDTQHSRFHSSSRSSTACFNPLKTKRIGFLQGLSTYRTVNTLHFGYKNQSLNIL
jgi:hypothetical protein